jgi:hypothetical protein
MEPEMRRMAVFAEWVFFSFILAIMISGVLVVYMYNQPPPVLNIETRAPITTVKAGQDFIVHNIFDRPVDCASWWHRYIFDDSQAQVSGFSEYRPADATPSYVRAIRMPSTLSPGKYTYEATIVWHCNWVQSLIPKEQKLPPVVITVVK